MSFFIGKKMLNFPLVLQSKTYDAVHDKFMDFSFEKVRIQQNALSLDYWFNVQVLGYRYKSLESGYFDVKARNNTACFAVPVEIYHKLSSSECSHLQTNSAYMLFYERLRHEDPMYEVETPKPSTSDDTSTQMTYKVELAKDLAQVTWWPLLGPLYWGPIFI